jgi:DNA helicase-2/ATP-dependent DNA helicase PcrA
VRHYRAEAQRLGANVAATSARRPEAGGATGASKRTAEIRPKPQTETVVRQTKYPVDRPFEREYLGRVLKLVAQQITASETVMRDAKQKLNRSGNDDFVGSAVLTWRVNNREEALTALESQRSTPYFGRIDFKEEGAEEDESLYIGRASVADEKHDLLVLDWRAPICSMYYGYNLGEASYRAPKGWIKGEIGLKRQYRIEGGKLIGVYDSTGGAGDLEDDAVDEMLLSMLKRNTTGKMRQIVQSIQSEQDAIIRSEGDIIVVQGPAGSGKTIIALHRAAYLLYHLRIERERLAQRFDHISAQRVLVFSPNSLFSDYISRVLPDLHEGQVRQVILEQFLLNELTRQLRQEGQAARYRIELKEDHFEAVQSPTVSADFERRAARAAFKASGQMLSAVAWAARTLEARIEDLFTDITLNTLSASSRGGRLFFSRDEMLRKFRAQSDTLPIVTRIEGVVKECASRLADVARLPYTQAATTRELEQHKRRLEERLKPFRDRSVVDLYRGLWEGIGAWHQEEVERSAPSALQAIAAETLATLNEGRLAYEDIVPLLLVSGAYRGFPSMRDIDHAVVDEAQDYSLLHYEYIRRCLPAKCGLTIVGDINQSLDPLLNIPDYDCLAQVFSNRIRRLELTRSYRSSQEITDFAGRILSADRRIDNVRRTGSRPKLIAAGSDTGSAVRAILDRVAPAGYNSIAILCRTRQDCRTLHRRLCPAIPATLIVDPADKLTSGIAIMPVPLAKGLEFDVVIVHDAGATCYHRDTERKLLYTACTRALHELYLCYSGNLSPLLSASVEDATLFETIELTPSRA